MYFEATTYCLTVGYSTPTKYRPMISADDMPPTFLNKDKQDMFRPALEKFYLVPVLTRNP